MDKAPMGVADYLKFDVVRPIDQFLNINSSIPERFLRLSAGGVKPLH